MKKIIFLFILFGVISLFADPPDWHPLQGTQYSMVVMATISLYDQPFEGEGNNMAAAFGPNGEDDCRAVATWQEPNPPYYEGFWFFTIVANINGELITFKIYNEANDNIYNCDGSIIFENNTTVGSPSDPYHLNVGNSTLSGTVFLETTTPPQGDVSQVTISVAGQIIHPDLNGNYTIQLDTGVYDISYSLEGYQTTILHNIEVTFGGSTENVDAHLIDWQPISGTQYSMVVMTTAVYNEENIEGDSSFKIAAFGPGGYEDCRGIAYWEEPNPPYWDGYWYITVVGNVQNELINFKLFNERTGEIIDCYQTLEFQDNTTVGSADEPWQISNGVTRNYNLNQGWNWVSFNIQPENVSVDSFFSSLEGVYQVKNQTQSATYFAEQETWVGDLSLIDLTKTYLVFMLNDFNGFTVSGIPVEVSTPISLNSGWNWVSYLPQNQKSLEVALSSIEENVYQIKSQSHSATFYNPPGSWVGDLETMIPGSGYKIKLLNPDTLIYEDGEKQKKYNDSFSKDAPLWQVITGTEYSMVLMAHVLYNDNEFTGENEENMVGAFGPGGEEDCRAIAIWEEATENWNGYWYFTIVGDTEGENITFKIYDANSDQVISCDDTLSFQINATVGNPFEPYEITVSLNSASTDQIIAPEYDLKIYPNPFMYNVSKRNFQSIYLNIPENDEATLIIYNLKGQKVKKFSIRKNQKLIRWNISNEDNIATGVYLYRLIGKNFEKIKKITIVK